jgi:hypothetical protein
MKIQPSMSADVVAAMQAAAQFAFTGKGDVAILRRIHEEAERITEEVYQKHGLVDVAVPAIRELRDSE